MAGSAQAGGQVAQPNINVLASQGIQGAGLGTVAGMQYQPQTLAQTNLAPYQDPYTQQVIEAQQADVLRGAQMGLQNLAGQAQQARAFGGSRHGVAMSELGRGVAETLGQQSAQLRSQAFQRAQEMAQQDIANQMQGAQMRLGASAQLADIANLGFGMGQTVRENLMQQGAQQRALQQQLMDIAQQRYQGYTQAPVTSLGYVSSALGASPIPQSQTTTKQAGLFDYLTLMAMA